MNWVQHRCSIVLETKSLYCRGYVEFSLFSVTLWVWHGSNASFEMGHIYFYWCYAATAGFKFCFQLIFTRSCTRMEYTSEQLLELFQNMLHRLQLVPEAPGRSSNKSGISFTVMTIPFWKWEDIP